jgi:hypothetical protein
VEKIEELRRIASTGVRSRLGSVAGERLTDDQLAALKDWGEGLAAVEHAEMQAAGRAIRMLVQEIEALQREEWHRRLENEAAPGPHAPYGESLLSGLMHRLARRSVDA